MRNDDNGEPKNYLDAVAALARSEGTLPGIVEELLQPELGDWVQSLGTRSTDMAVLRAELKKRLPEKVRRDGVPALTAALQLGITEQSLQEIVNGSLPMIVARLDPSGRRMFLKDELNAFVSSYLPNFKTWGSRTSLLREFHRSLASQTGLNVDPQPCEIGGCQELAAVVCANPDCRPPARPRMVCVAHREHLRSRSDMSLCEECVRRVLYGDLKDRFQIAGTEQRLLKVHPQ